MIVIAVDFAAEDLPGIVNHLDVFLGAGAYQSILEPAIRPFDLAFSLRGEGVAGVNVTVSKDPFPLRVYVVGDQIMFSPDGVPALDEAENRVRVGVISVGGSIAKDHAFQGGDMVPAGLLFNELRIQQLTAKIIEARDEMPFLLGVGGPSMVGRVVLDEFSDIIGQHLPIMGFALGPAQKKVMFFGPSNDRRHRDLLSILLP
jgi:hypothetical protein